jgi:predicted phosphate transport protein (TIGR00153 family)
MCLAQGVKMGSILKKKIGIEMQVDDFLNQISEAGLLFKTGVDTYLRGNKDAFIKKIDEIAEVEHRGDTLRRSIQEQLYLKTLIPESRGDVLELLENMDALLDRFKGAIWRFEIERIEIAPKFHDEFKELVSNVVEASEAIVRSVRAFFKDTKAVADHMHKVSFWETESDKVSTSLQRRIFRQKDMRLSHRMQLREFVRHVDKIADRAEDVADKLNIFVIKRYL